MASYIVAKGVFVLGDPSFRVNMQKWPKTLYFLFYFVLIKGIYEIVQAHNTSFS